MPVKFTESFKINPLVFKGLGVFDVILDVDTRVFFDPARISLASAPEFIGARKKVEQYCVSFPHFITERHSGIAVTVKYNHIRRKFNHFFHGTSECGSLAVFQLVIADK